jgi:hypothetical protein
MSMGDLGTSTYSFTFGPCAVEKTPTCWEVHEAGIQVSPGTSELGAVDLLLARADDTLNSPP